MGISSNGIKKNLKEYEKKRINLYFDHASFMGNSIVISIF